MNEFLQLTMDKWVNQEHTESEKIHKTYLVIANRDAHISELI